MSQLLLDLEKAGTYLKRWRGKNGKWYYKYDEDKTAKYQASAKQAKEGGKVENEAKTLFTSATEKMGWASVAMVEYLSDNHGISSYDDMKRAILEGGRSKASAIYKDIKDYVDSQSTLPTGAKGEILHRMGSAMVNVVKMLPPEKQAKPKLMIKVTTPEGKTKYKKTEVSSPAFPATKVKAARARMGGWTNMTTLPTTTQIKAMVDKKSAKVVKGKLNAKKKFEVYQKLEHIVVPFKEKDKGVVFKLRQTKKNNDRKSTTALVELTVPYAYARQFVKNQIKSTKTGNEIIRQMERSAGYKKTLGIE